MREIPRIIYDAVKSPIINLFIKFGITANQLTLFNHFITLTFGCYWFSTGKYIDGLLALGVMFINGFLDYADGEIAKKTNRFSQLGIWLDSGFDVIIQNAVMGAIAVGCYKHGLSLWVIILFFISNSASNWVSFNYNHKFGFDSDKGNSLFRDLISKRSHWANKIIGDMIDPTSNFIALLNYTYRYWIMIGIVFNVMPLLFLNITIVCTVRWIVMYVIYALYLSGEKRPYILRVLASLDEDRNEFYRLRYSQKV